MIFCSFKSSFVITNFPFKDTKNLSSYIYFYLGTCQIQEPGLDLEK